MLRHHHILGMSKLLRELSRSSRRGSYTQGDSTTSSQPLHTGDRVVVEDVPDLEALPG